MQLAVDAIVPCVSVDQQPHTVRTQESARIEAWAEQAIIDQEVLATRRRLQQEYRGVFPQL